MPDLPPPEYDGTGRHLPPFDPTKVRTNDHLEGSTSGPLIEDQPARLRNIKATAEQVTRSNLGPVDDVFHDAAWAAGIAIQALNEVGRLRRLNDELDALFESQRKRMGEAAELWCKEDPELRQGKLPDLGELLGWLLTERTEARDLLAQCDESIRGNSAGWSDEQELLLELERYLGARGR